MAKTIKSNQMQQDVASDYTTKTVTAKCVAKASFKYPNLGPVTNVQVDIPGFSLFFQSSHLVNFKSGELTPASKDAIEAQCAVFAQSYVDSIMQNKHIVIDDITIESINIVK